ncbi:hypothetical protein, variant 1 [Aphanomyces invadans]|uniref:PWWP domain-containing protein n=1 Tax=Aphanomyces invadans TaxID=157072 RepID=A0A024TFB2_9STRA|nr:hypothetical protein, variant 1 [Aphanomyces invadans]ETV92276.1 hypothetical protein, variant 1 [Aphanomyces invadans]|eukprot:XP_008879027.1 hypothetical protein, variant 1 [Aphanomyces invadans]
MMARVGRRHTRRPPLDATTVRSVRSLTASRAPIMLTSPAGEVIEISSDDDSDVVVDMVIPAPANSPFSEYGGYYSPTGGAVRRKKRKPAVPTTLKTPEQELHDTAVLAARMFDQNAALSPEVKSMYSQVAWCRLRGWPYWPGYVCSPHMLAVDSETMEAFVPFMSTHYWIYFYGCNKSAAVPHSSVVPWDDASKPYREGYPSGGPHRAIGLADAVDLAEEYKLPADERVAWVISRVKTKVMCRGGGWCIVSQNGGALRLMRGYCCEQESAQAARKTRRRYEPTVEMNDAIDGAVRGISATGQLKGATMLRDMQLDESPAQSSQAPTPNAATTP